MKAHADKAQENITSETNSVSEQQCRNTSSFQFVDNRPEAVAQRKLQEIANNSPHVKKLGAYQEMADKKLDGNRNHHQTSSEIVQKMAVMTVDDMDKQEDTLVWNNIENAVSKATGPIGDLNKNKVWDQLEDNEEIRLIEHGEVKSVGGKSAADIANSMFTPPNNLPNGNDIGKVTFQSCYAGVTGGAGSLVSDMVGELKSHGYTGVPVEGRTGVAFGFKGMGEATAETDTGTYTWNDANAETLFNTHLSTDVHAPEKGFKAYFDAQYALQGEKTKTTNVNIFKYVWTYNDPWVLIDLPKADWINLPVEKRSELVAEEMEPYMKKLKETMKSYGGFKAEKDAIISEKAKSKLCFITTACVEAMGLPDDCEELTVLRQFRDNYLLQKLNGAALVELYYKYSPQIVTAIHRREDEEEILKRLYRIIRECVDAIKRGDNEFAYKTYCKMVLELKEEFIPSKADIVNLKKGK